MAKIKHKPHIEEMIGAHSKDGTVERRKVFRDYDGNVTRVGGNYAIGYIALTSDNTAEMNGLEVTLSIGSFPIRGMRYFGIVSAGGMAWSTITEQVFPAKMTLK